MYIGLFCSSIEPKSLNPHHKGESFSSRLIHRHQGFKDPTHHNPQLKMVLWGTRQANLDRTSHPRQPITRAVLHRLLDQVRHFHKLHKYDKHLLTAFLLAFFGFLRCKSTLVTFPTPLQVGAQPLFTFRDGSPLTRHSCLKHLLRFLHKAGYLPQDFNTHSFRIGAATSAAYSGLPAHQIELKKQSLPEIYSLSPPSQSGS